MWENKLRWTQAEQPTDPETRLPLSILECTSVWGFLAARRCTVSLWAEPTVSSWIWASPNPRANTKCAAHTWCKAMSGHFNNVQWLNLHATSPAAKCSSLQGTSWNTCFYCPVWENASSPRSVKITRQSRGLEEQSSGGTDRAISSDGLLHRSHRLCDETKWWNYNGGSNVCALLPGCLHRPADDLRDCLAASHRCHFKTPRKLCSRCSGIQMCPCPPPRPHGVEVIRNATVVSSAAPQLCSSALRLQSRWSRGRADADAPQTRPSRPGDGLDGWWIWAAEGGQAASDNWAWDSVAPKLHGLTDEMIDVGFTKEGIIFSPPSWGDVEDNNSDSSELHSIQPRQDVICVFFVFFLLLLLWVYVYMYIQGFWKGIFHFCQLTAQHCFHLHCKRKYI